MHMCHIALGAARLHYTLPQLTPQMETFRICSGKITGPICLDIFHFVCSVQRVVGVVGMRTILERHAIPYMLDGELLLDISFLTD